MSGDWTAFDKHILTTLAPASPVWRCKDPHSSGLWFEMAAMVDGTHLVVAGDIDVVVFGRHSPGKQGVRELALWIGSSGIDYAAEKARIGMGASRQDGFIHETTLETALQDLAQCDEDIIPGDIRRGFVEEHPETLEELRTMLIAEGVDSELVSSLGERHTQRFLTAYHALQHVAKILRGGTP